MNFRRAFPVLVAALLAVAILYFVLPWVAAFVRYERLKRYIKVEMNYPGCIPGEQSFEAMRCRCEFIFEGIRKPADLRFEGTDLHRSLDVVNRTYTVSGTGVISAGKSQIVISSHSVSINGTELPSDRYSSFHVFIRSDGRLENSRIEF